MMLLGGGLLWANTVENLCVYRISDLWEKSSNSILVLINMDADGISEYGWPYSALTNINHHGGGERRLLDSRPSQTHFWHIQNLLCDAGIAALVLMAFITLIEVFNRRREGRKP